MTGTSFAVGDELSPEVVRGVPEAREVLRELLDRPVGQTVSEGCSTG